MGEVSAICKAQNPFVSAQGFMHQIKKIKKNSILLFRASSHLSRAIRCTFKVSHSGATEHMEGLGYFFNKTTGVIVSHQILEIKVDEQ